jgi:hypothetical protein
VGRDLRRHVASDELETAKEAVGYVLDHGGDFEKPDLAAAGTSSS